MLTKKKPALRELPKIPKELLEQFGAGLMTAESIEDVSAAFKKALIERALNA
jgi:putative transposase